MILAAHINGGGVEDSSDVTAVICTANIIFFSSSIPRNISEDLTEWCFGEENGKAIAQRRNAFVYPMRVR